MLPSSEPTLADLLHQRDQLRAERDALRAELARRGGNDVMLQVAHRQLRDAQAAIATLETERDAARLALQRLQLDGS